MSHSNAKGFNLIELMTVVVIISILVLIGAPAFTEWVQNTRTRSVAESLQNGIRFAQGEAARLSRQTILQTTTSTWQVTFVKLSGVDDAVASNVLQSSQAGDLNLDNVLITPSGPTYLEFNDLGRVAGSTSSTGFTPLTAEVSFLIANSKAPRQLKVTVSPSGKVRMCDPSKTFSNTDPDGC